MKGKTNMDNNSHLKKVFWRENVSLLPILFIV